MYMLGQDMLHNESTGNTIEVPDWWDVVICVFCLFLFCSSVKNLGHDRECVFLPSMLFYPSIEAGRIGKHSDLKSLNAPSYKGLSGPGFSQTTEDVCKLICFNRSEFLTDTDHATLL